MLQNLTQGPGLDRLSCMGLGTFHFHDIW